MNLIRITYKKNLQMNLLKEDTEAQSAHNLRNNQITIAAKRIQNFQTLTSKSILGLTVVVRDFLLLPCVLIKAPIIYPRPLDRPTQPRQVHITTNGFR